MKIELIFPLASNKAKGKKHKALKFINCLFPKIKAQRIKMIKLVK